MAQSLFLESENPADFLYLDRNRIASLIGQLSDKGMLTEYKSTVGKSQNLEGQAGGTIKVVKAEGKLSRASSESAEETYDPFWAHAYSFIQDLNSNFAVPLAKARLGSLVKFDAHIQFLDLKIMKNVWEPGMQAFTHSQPQSPQLLSRKQRRQQTSQPQLSKEMKLGLQVFKELPHLFHMTFLTKEGYRLWAAVRPNNLTISTEDLTMKYGAVMDGLWTVLGIVDGNVGEPPKPLPINPVMDGIITAMAGLRQIMGRPTNHFGLTPLAIYAPVTGIAEAEAATTPAPDPGPAPQI